MENRNGEHKDKIENTSGKVQMILQENIGFGGHVLPGPGHNLQNYYEHTAIN